MTIGVPGCTISPGSRLLLSTRPAAGAKSWQRARSSSASAASALARCSVGAGGLDLLGAEALAQLIELRCGLVALAPARSRAGSRAGHARSAATMPSACRAGDAVVLAALHRELGLGGRARRQRPVDLCSRAPLAIMR